MDRSTGEEIENRLLTSNETITKENFGSYGNVYFIKIVPDQEDISSMSSTNNSSSAQPQLTLKEAKKWWNDLDVSSTGRSTQQIQNFFTSGSYIETRTDKNAQHHHNLFVKSLYRPEVYMRNILTELQSSFDVSTEKKGSLRSCLTDPIRRTLAKGMFSLREVPAELDAALNSFTLLLEESRTEFKDNIKFNLYGSSIFSTPPLDLPSDYRDIKNKYFQASSDFLSNQSEAILKEIHCIAKNEPCFNLVSLSIVEIIKEKFPDFRSDKEDLNNYLLSLDTTSLKSYLTSPEIITLPASITAGDLSVIVFSCAITALAGNPEIHAQLRSYLRQNDYLKNLNSDNVTEIKNFFDQDSKNNGYLHRFYLESLRRENLHKTKEQLPLEQSLLFRYTNESVTLGDYNIPANSHVVFLPGTLRFDMNLWNSPELFDPNRFIDHSNLGKYSLSIFSEGNRRCPAYNISAYIFKTFISYIALNFDIKLEKGEDIRLNQIQVTFNPIRQEKKLELEKDTKKLGLS